MLTLTSLLSHHVLAGDLWSLTNIRPQYSLLLHVSRTVYGRGSGGLRGTSPEGIEVGGLRKVRDRAGRGGRMEAGRGS